MLLAVLMAGSASAQTAATATSELAPASLTASLSGLRTTDSPVPAPTSGADAAQRKPANPQTSGPMTVVPVRNAFIITPEIRFGQINHRDEAFAGATAGILMNNRLFLGAGGYWLVENNSRDLGLGYAGVVAGVYVRGEGPVDLSLTALVGGGWATAAWDGEPYTLGTNRHMNDGYYQSGDSGWNRWDHADGFFVAEPSANLCIRVSRRIWISAGVGYRFISGTNGVDNELRGATGSVAVTFGRR
jgi:hypothetical protein